MEIDGGAFVGGETVCGVIFKLMPLRLGIDLRMHAPHTFNPKVLHRVVDRLHRRTLHPS